MEISALHQEAVDRLHSAVLKRAATEPLLFASKKIPGDWLSEFPSEQLWSGPTEARALATRVEITSRQASSLSSERFGDRVVLTTALVEPLLSSSLGREALIAMSYLRSHLAGADAHVDMYLILVTPPGSNESESWLSARRALECNEHICRTLAWLAPERPDDWDESISSFLSRSFLALPFGPSTGSARALDPLRQILREASSSTAPLGGLTDQRTQRLEAILTSRKVGSDIAKELVEVLRENEE